MAPKPICDVRQTNLVAHALLPPLTSPMRIMLCTLDETTNSSGSPTVPQICRSGKRRRTQHTQTRAGYQCSLTRIIQKGLQRSGVTSNNPTAPQTKSARHPESQSASKKVRATPFSHFISKPKIWHSGPHPKAHWYMCTDYNHYTWLVLDTALECHHRPYWVRYGH